MRHLTPLSKTLPAPAFSMLEWAQIGSILGVFASALGTLASAFNVLTQGLERKGAYEE